MLVPHNDGGVIRVPVPAPATITSVSVQRPVVAVGVPRTKFTKSKRIWQISVPRLFDKKK